MKTSLTPSLNSVLLSPYVGKRPCCTKEYSSVFQQDGMALAAALLAAARMGLGYLGQI